jgi:hypothetical protein
MASPFDWNTGEPSVFGKDKYMRAEKDGMTRSIRQTRVHAKLAQEGKKVPTALSGMTIKADSDHVRRYINPNPPEFMVRAKEDE